MAPSKRSASAAPTSISERVWPGRSTFVLSEQSTATPCSPSSAKRRVSAGSPSSGLGSSLKSPVWTMVPTGVVIARPMPSAIECVTRMGSMVNGPSVNGSRGRMSRRSAGSGSGCSRSFSATSARVSGVAYTGTRADFKRYGSAPMWSSWPCVSTTPRKPSRLASA